MKPTRRQYLLGFGGSILTAADRSLSEEWRQIARATDAAVGAAAAEALGSHCQAASTGDLVTGGFDYPENSECITEIELIPDSPDASA